MQLVALNTLRLLDMAYPCCVTPFPTILVLWNSWVHVCTTNCCNKASNVEASVDNFLGIWTALSVPNIDPDYGHVRLGRDFDDTRFRCKDNIVKNVVAFENAFNVIWGNASVWTFVVVWDACNFEVGLRLWKSWGGDPFHIRWKGVFDIFLNFL